ncbi:hypothetical protein JCM19235_1963 [Vibrio maritimus]|uniref:Uncharacterized protein n=1 Tax=Vibrio maritimus TaxID=990268 RepID=A0A090RT19_9VIBR|nr:hypothetical protein JCM19235_1963 [Vibrio maritimus]
MTVGNSYIDGRTNQDFLHAGTDKFRVTHNGELYAEEGTFGGEVQADKISGDIVSAIVKPATLRTSSVTQSNQQADTSTVSSFTVTTGRPYIRTLVTYSTCSLDLHPSSSARAEGNAWAVVYGTGSGGSGNLSEVRSAAVHHAVALLIPVVAMR